MSEAEQNKYEDYPYHIWVLDHDLLHYIEHLVEQAGDKQNGYLDENTPELGELLEARDVVQVYRDLMSNLPRVDKSIGLIYGPQVVSLEKAIQDEMNTGVVSPEEKIKKKSRAALTLFERGYYLQLAVIKAECADDCMALVSGTVLPNWRTTKSKEYLVIDDSARHAGSYDLVMRFNKPFMKMSLGYIDLTEGVYASELV